MKISIRNLKKAIACIKRHKHFLITTHVNSEGDALGSELAFYHLLRILGKQAVIINEDDIPSEYDFLPGAGRIKKFNRRIKNVKFDCFVILDCSDLKRCGEVFRLNGANKPVLNIDHHISNDNFGDVNWVEPLASSTAEMVYFLYKKLHIHFTRDIAECLYAGILTDTGSFHYPNTTSFTHEAASELLKYNLDIARIYKRAYENIPFEDMKMLAKILLGLKRKSGGKIVWVELKQDLLRNKKVSFDLSEQILSFARAIEGGEAVALFKENLGKKNEIRVNLRSQGKVDVNKIAQFFGGGGHKTASGCTVKGRLADVRRKVLARLAASLK